VCCEAAWHHFTKLHCQAAEQVKTGCLVEAATAMNNR